MTIRLARLAGAIAAVLATVTVHAARLDIARPGFEFDVLSSLPATFGGRVVRPLVEGADGLAYGDSNYDPEFGTGVVFRFDASGNRIVLATGLAPSTALVRGVDGLLYGASLDGGSRGTGEIFRITAAGVVETVHSFTRSTDHGLIQPTGDLVPDGSGGWYCVGVVEPTLTETLFHLDADDQVTLLDSFVGPDLGKGVGNLIRAPDGRLYGSTELAPTSVTRESVGSLFVFGLDGHLRTIHTFSSQPTDGNGPGGELAIGSDGAVYGTTVRGGTWDTGVAFRIGRDDSYRVIREFRADPSDPIGGPPLGLTSDPDGELFGVGELGGRLNSGTVFTMTRTGAAHVINVFNAGDSQGWWPIMTPSWFSDGTLLGLTSHGGAAGGGTLYRIRRVD